MNFSAVVRNLVPKVNCANFLLDRDKYTDKSSLKSSDKITFDRDPTLVVHIFISTTRERAKKVISKKNPKKNFQKI